LVFEFKNPVKVVAMRKLIALLTVVLFLGAITVRPVKAQKRR